MTEKKPKIAVATPDEAEAFVTGRNGRDAGATADSPPDSAADADRPESDAVRTERDEFRDKYLRAQAECANISRRLTQQHAEAMRTAHLGLAKDLLPVLDNFERTLASIAEHARDEPIAAGVRLIADQLAKALRDHGIEPIEALGAAFDPAMHEAVMQDAGSDAAPGAVTKEFARGYRLYDRVIRPSKVAVAVRPPEAPGGESAKSPDDSEG